MSSVRLRRLQADYERLQEYVRRHPRLQMIQAHGEPPERYQIQYQIRSLKQKDDRLVAATSHLVEIVLPLHYPRTPPQCRMLTPVFHPNIAPHAICIGDHWTAGQPLASVVARIGELLAYQSYNTKSPLNGEAARWVNENLDQLPLDPISMLVEEATEAAAPPVPGARRGPPAIVPAAGAETIEFTCPGCGTRLRVRAALHGKQVRCPRCHNAVQPPEGKPNS